MALHDWALAPISTLSPARHGLAHSILYAETILLFLELAKQILIAEPLRVFSPSLEVAIMASPSLP